MYGVVAPESIAQAQAALVLTGLGIAKVLTMIILTQNPLEILLLSIF